MYVIQIVAKPVGDRRVAAKSIDLRPSRYADLAAMTPVVFLKGIEGDRLNAGKLQSRTVHSRMINSKISQRAN
jgi:hypothetical protein